MLLRLLHKIRVKLKIWTTLGAILANKKVIMLINILTNQKTTVGLDKLYINNWEKRYWIKIYTLYIIF